MAEWVSRYARSTAVLLALAGYTVAGIMWGARQEERLNYITQKLTSIDTLIDKLDTIGTRSAGIYIERMKQHDDHFTDIEKLLSVDAERLRLLNDKVILIEERQQRNIQRLDAIDRRGYGGGPPPP